MAARVGRGGSYRTELTIPSAPHVVVVAIIKFGILL
jgi:hypothetical protein